MHVVIIGGGQVGAYLGNLLLENGCTVRIIENRTSVYDKLQKELPEGVAIKGNGADPKILEQAGIEEADVVTAVTGKDEVNLVTATIAKYEFGIRRVIARVNNPQNEWLFTREMGVDIKVNQANLMSRLIVDEIDIKNMMTLLKINEGDNSIVQFSVHEDSDAANHAIKELQIPDDAVLIAIRRDHEVLIPRGDSVILPGDHVMALAANKGQAFLGKLFDDCK